MYTRGCPEATFTAPRWSNCTEVLLPEIWLRLAAPTAVAIGVVLGGDPAGERVAEPVIKYWVSFASTVPLAFESTQINQFEPFCWIWQRIGVFLRMASNRVSF